MPKVSEAIDVRSIAVDRLKWSRAFLKRLLEGVPDEAYLSRAGGAGNHAMWVAGHVATTDAFMLGAYTGRTPSLPVGFEELFGGGSKVFDDASVYPSRDEVERALRDCRDAVIRWIRSMDDGALRAPAPGDLAPFAPDAVTTAFGIAAHEMFHAGQIASVRSARGMRPVMF